MERSFYVVAYDIVEDKRRAKLAKYLESIGNRVQGSVFEMYLSSPELEKLLKKAARLINEKEDTVRIYDLCSTCRTKVYSLGQGKLTAAPGLVIV